MEVKVLVIPIDSVFPADLFADLSTWKRTRSTFQGKGHDFPFVLYNNTIARFPIATAKAVAVTVVVTAQIVS
jgi:hypothetical protein